MANRWNIPPDLEHAVRARDLSCIYCGVLFSTPATSRKAMASWEHIVNDASIITPANIARCCCACNSSKGQKPLSQWLNGTYCQKHGITKDTISRVARFALDATTDHQ